MNGGLLVAMMLQAVAQPSGGSWDVQDSWTDARLRAVAAVGEKAAWASGQRGTVVRTTDGGALWRRVPVPDGASLDFRDLHAFDDRAAVVLAIGAGELSRIYRTVDGGQAWKLAWMNRDPKAFYDAIAFWDDRHGLALGDPVDGRFALLVTDDGGESWERLAPESLPPALDGEGAFAASGTCLVAQGDRRAWFATGGGGKARVFRTEDRGRSWTAHETPVRAARPSSGLFSLTFRDGRHGVAVGGDYTTPEGPAGDVIVTDDGGLSWACPARGGLPGFRSAVADLLLGGSAALVAVGPSGGELSTDGGASWTEIDRSGFHAVSFAPGTASGWAVGEDGRIARFRPAPAK